MKEDVEPSRFIFRFRCKVVTFVCFPVWFDDLA